MLDGFGQAPVCLELDLDSYDGPSSHVARFRGRSGWLIVAEGWLTTADQADRITVSVACDEWGEAIPGWQAAHLLECACSHPQSCGEYPPDQLQDLLAAEGDAAAARWLRENDAAVRALTATADAAVAAAEARAGALVERALAQIADLRRRRRLPGLTADNLVALDEATATLEIGIEATLANLRREVAAHRNQAERREQALLTDAAVTVELEPLYVVSWHDGAATREQADDRVGLDWRPVRVEFTYEAERRNAWWRERQAEGHVTRPRSISADKVRAR